MIRSLYLTYKSIYFRIYIRYCNSLTMIYFYLNEIKYSTFNSIGVPFLDIHPNGKCRFGKGLSMVNKAKFATLGKSNRCKIIVQSGGSLCIGEKVGMSNTTIVATSSIIIGNNILIGGGVTIVDTDFHSFNPVDWHTDADYVNIKKSPVVINDNVFIGMNSIILKGVTIGQNVIIGAGSVVSKDIPDNQIWGGNPAQFIKNRLI